MSSILQVRIFEISIPNLLSEADPIAVLDKLFASIALLRRTPLCCDSSSRGSAARSDSGWSPSTPSKSSGGSVMSTPQSRGGFMSPGTVASTPARNNTFAYRSPAAMMASAAASAASTPAPSTKKTHSISVATPGPFTSTSKAPFVSPFANAGATAKKGPGGKTPPPASLQDMLSASRGGAKGVGSLPKRVEVESIAAERVPMEEGSERYAAEMAFLVIDEVINMCCAVTAL